MRSHSVEERLILEGFDEELDREVLGCAAYEGCLREDELLDEALHDWDHVLVEEPLDEGYHNLSGCYVFVGVAHDEFVEDSACPLLVLPQGVSVALCDGFFIGGGCAQLSGDLRVDEELDEGEPGGENVVSFEEFRQIHVDAHVERSEEGFEEVRVRWVVDAHELRDDVLVDGEDDGDDLVDD